MTERQQDTAKDLSKLVEQSVSTLQEVDRRLQMVRTDLANLIHRASAVRLEGGLPGQPQNMGGRMGPASPGPAGIPALAGSLGPLQSIQAMQSMQPPGLASGYGGQQPFLPHASAQGGPFTPYAAQGSFAGAGFGATPLGPSTQDVRKLPPQTRIPIADLVDEGEDFVIQIELPGVKKEDLDLVVSDRTISLTAESRPETGEGAVLLNERGAVQFRRIIPLPSEVATTHSKATFKDGILTLKVPKKVPAEGPRKLDVAYS